MAFRFVSFCAGLLLAAPLFAEPFEQAFPGALDEVLDEYVQGIAALDIHHGTFELPGGIAALNLPDEFYALDVEDSRYLLETIWENPPSPATLGMVFPAHQTPYEAEWGIEISFEDIGYVSDSDAATMDFDALLTQMQADARSASDVRRKEGYSGYEILGWAEPPHYDAGAHKLYWAELAQFEGEPVKTLNYKIRILGRKGVLQLNFIAAEDALPAVKAAAPAVLAMTTFNDGHRYADFDSSVDQVAAVGIGGLIAGTLASKTGLLALALVFLKKGFVFVLMGGAFVLSKLRGLFGGAPKTTAPPVPPEPADDSAPPTS